MPLAVISSLDVSCTLLYMHVNAIHAMYIGFVASVRSKNFIVLTLDENIAVATMAAGFFM